MGPTTLLPSCADCLDILAALPSGVQRTCSGLDTNSFSSTVAIRALPLDTSLSQVTVVTFSEVRIK